MHIDRYEKTVFEWKFSPMANYICPPYKVTRREANSPRGLALLVSLVQGKQQRKLEPVVAERMYQCSSCYLCTSHGYDDTDPASLFIAARADIVEAGLAPAPVLRHRDRLLAKPQPLQLPRGRSKARVGLVVDPYIAAAFPKELAANLELLSKAGVEFSVLGAEEGCGAQLFELGFLAEARERAAAVAKQAASVDTVVFCSPYDFKLFTGWSGDLGVELPAAVEKVPLPAYLTRLVREGKLRFGGAGKKGAKTAVSYLDAGHFVRPQTSFEGIAELVAGMPDIELKSLWRGGRLAPTDSGDFLPHVYPKIAEGIDAKLLESLRETGSRTILVSCLYTLANLRRTAAAADAAGSPAIEDLGTFLLGCM
jgi:Fe-S oxidoreductase